MFKRKEGKIYKGLKRSPFKTKPDHKQLQQGTTPLKKLGKQGKKWQKDRREKSRPESIKAGITHCTLQYEGCWREAQGHCHSLKRVNRTRPEHDWETTPGCNWCHEILERKGKEEMAKEVRRIRQEWGLPIWPEEENNSE